jgi:hypothetical protein
MKRRLFVHERELQSWRSLTLTSHRVIHLDVRHGFACSTSIPLAHVQWTRLTRSHRPVLLVLAAILGSSCLFALAQDAKEIGALFCLIAIVTGIAYLSTRQAIFMLASGGGRIELPIGANEKVRQQARDFLDAIEQAAGCTTVGTAVTPSRYPGAT